MPRVYYGNVGYVGEESTVPGTPWKEKYGGLADSRFSGTGQSGFRPLFPEIPQPFGMGMDLSSPQNWWQIQPRPPGAELDRMFLSERFQTQTCAGLRTWQLPSMNHGVPSTPRNFTINESNWHPVLRKERWFDYRRPDEPPGSTPHWSVDNNRFWDEIKIPLEMANRLLGQVMKTQW